MVEYTSKKTPLTDLVRQGRYFRRSALGTLGFCTSWAIDRKGVGPEWVEVSQVDLPIPNLADPLRGLRIAHVSDLHCSTTTSSAYLHRCIERINMLGADAVVLTGDYITYDFQGRYREKVVDVLAEVMAKRGVFACLGNHDYGMQRTASRKRAQLLRRMTRGMEAKGVNVLRNEADVLDVDGHRLWFVGLGDLWMGDFQPDTAFVDVPTDQAAIALVHNPRGVEHLGEFHASVVMSGHTHGRKTTITPPGQKNQERPYHAGLYEVEGKQLYVNRGLGRVGRARFNARPEITVFTLC